MSRNELTGRLAITVPAVLGTALGAWGLWLGLVRAPLDARLGVTQKIFYLHAPIGIWTILLVVFAACCGVAYLWKRSPRADLLGAAAMDAPVESRNPRRPMAGREIGKVELLAAWRLLVVAVPPRLRGGGRNLDVCGQSGRAVGRVIAGRAIA